MDSFISETLSSDSSTSEEVVEAKAQKRKIRKTEDLISTNILDSPDEVHPISTVAVQQVAAFLPKIDLSDDKSIPLSKKSKHKMGLLEKQRDFQLGRSAIEARAFTISKLKFPKIKLVLKNKKVGKHKGVKKDKSKKNMKSSNRLKKKLKSPDGKENKVSGLPSSSKGKKKSRSNINSFDDVISPCTVVLEKLSIETMRPYLKKLEESNACSVKYLISPCKVILEKLSPEMIRSLSKSDTSSLEINNFTTIKRKAASLNVKRNSIIYFKTKKLRTSLAIDEEMPFIPKDSSSPVCKPDNSELLQDGEDKNATFDINQTRNKDDTEYKRDKLNVSGISVLSSSNKNLTYELNKSQDVLNENNTTYEITDVSTTTKPREYSKSDPGSATSSRGSTFTKEDWVSPQPLLRKSELVTDTQQEAIEEYKHDSLMLEDESPPWNHNKQNDSTSQVNSTYTTSLEELPDENSINIEVPDSERSVPNAEVSSSSENNWDVNQNKELDSSLIEISDDNGTYNTSRELSGNEVEETNITLKSKLNETSISFAQLTRPKSVIKSKNSVSKKRKVTFSEMSIIIVDDSSDSEDTPKKMGTPVPTNFPSDSDNEETQLDKEKTERTPLRAYVKLMRTPFPDEDESYFQSPQVTSTSSQNKNVNRKTLAGRTPVRLSESKLNKRISASEKVTSSSISKKTKSIKKTKMPDFAKLHKRLYDNMLNLEEYSAQKTERARMLLSGQKPKPSPRKSIQTNSTKKVSPKNKVTSKKQLNYTNSSKPASQKRTSPKNKGVKNIKTGFTRYGFKVTENCDKKDQVEAVANKTRPQKKDPKNIQIKGVRSNRRFELLMKMRQQKETV